VVAAIVLDLYGEKVAYASSLKAIAPAQAASFSTVSMRCYFNQ